MNHDQARAELERCGFGSNTTEAILHTARKTGASVFRTNGGYSSVSYRDGVYIFRWAAKLACCRYHSNGGRLDNPCMNRLPVPMS